MKIVRDWVVIIRGNSERQMKESHYKLKQETKQVSYVGKMGIRERKPNYRNVWVISKCSGEVEIN